MNPGDIGRWFPSVSRYVRESHLVVIVAKAKNSELYGVRVLISGKTGEVPVARVTPVVMSFGGPVEKVERR